MTNQAQGGYLAASNQSYRLFSESRVRQYYSHEQLTATPEDDTRQMIDLYLYLLTKGVALQGKNGYFNAAAYQKDVAGTDALETCEFRMSRGKEDPRDCHFKYGIDFSVDNFSMRRYVMGENGLITYYERERTAGRIVDPQQPLNDLAQYFGTIDSGLLLDNFTKDKASWLKELEDSRGIRLDDSQKDVDSSTYDGYESHLFCWKFDEGKLAITGLTRAAVMERLQLRVNEIIEANRWSPELAPIIRDALVFKSAGLHPGAVKRLTELTHRSSPLSLVIGRIWYGTFLDGRYLLE